MGIRNAARGLAKTLRRVARDRRGGVAMIFALAIVPLVLATGVGIDVSRVAGARSQLQDATDAAGLALARYPGNSDLKTVLEPAAKKWIVANLHGTTIDPNSVDVALTPLENGVLVTAATQVQPTLAAIAHLGPFPVQATSTIKYDVTHVEVALVLDTTGSMGQSLDGTQTKIQVLKQASQNLINTLMTPANAGGVKIGVVPYAEYVNVGMANRNASWMTVLPDTSVTTHHNAVDNRNQCTTVSSKTTTSCVGGVWNPNCSTTTTYKDGVPSTSTNGCWAVPQVCTTVTTPVTPYQQCGTYTAAYDSTVTSKWFGCAKYQLQGAQLSLPDPAGAYTGIMEPWTSSRYCLSEILPMNGDKTTVTAAINGLITSRPNYADPSTYIPGGLHWGVNLLSPPTPFSEGDAYDPKNVYPRKAIILMTDGANTKYLNSSTPGLLNATSSNSTPNATQLTPTYSDQDRMCAYAKSKNIEIYTIGFGVSDATSLSHLQTCATDDAHYFDAKNSAALLNAFQVIAGSLSKLRISH